jgi:ABC-2 type transport system ATP-binding protein
MTASDSNVIDTRGLSKAYGDVAVLKGLDLKVPRHSIFGFLGPNGAGKSTTIKLLLGLTRPTGGTATVFGQDITRDSTAIRQRVGYLAQDPRYYEDLTARQTMRFVAGFFYDGPKAVVEDRIQQTLELVGLDDKADRPIKGFSGGERQRLGIAQAQVNYPDLLILDEPAASLDPMGRRDVLEVMERLKQHTHHLLLHPHPERRAAGERHGRHPEPRPARGAGAHRAAPAGHRRRQLHGRPDR